MFNQKECGLLKDLKNEEELCIEKYTKYEHNATNPKLKELMGKIADQERSHLRTIECIMSSNIPAVPAAKGSGPAPQPNAGYVTGSPEYNNDKFILSDLLSTEKRVSSLYNTCIFEFKDTTVRGNLNHIQKEEQEHGEMLYSFMSANNMYS